MHTRDVSLPVTLRVLRNADEHFDVCTVCSFPSPGRKIENQSRALEVRMDSVVLLQLQGAFLNEALRFM